MRRGARIVSMSVLFVAMAMAPNAQAFHLYRGPGGGCTPLDGATGDGAQVTPAATVKMLHNVYTDTSNNLPVTHIRIGQAVKWTWNSVHCHSVTGGDFDSGFHYPTKEPTSIHAVPGFFDYPVLEDVATLTYTHVFAAAGTFQYACVHHNVIGMQGVVIVDP
jgi:plastocyanin